MKEQESFEEAKEKKFYRRVLEGKLLFIVGVPVLALMISFFIFHFYRVDGSSMEHTFQDKNLLLVEKAGKTSSSLLHKAYTPRRYDVIVFKQPDFDPNIEIVKRVIGLPGDRVIIKKGKVIVYNQKYPEGFEVDNNMPPETSVVVDNSDFDITDVRVSPGQVFVLGDNRPGSDDSRFFGPVETKNIIGKVIIRLSPLNEFWIL